MASSSSSSSSSYVKGLSSSSSWISSTSESTENLSRGVTYCNEFKDVTCIANPLVDNDVNMQFAGFFDEDWVKNELEFDKLGYGIKKRINNRGTIFCNDASKLFSKGVGYVGMILSLNEDIINGIYKPLFKKNENLNEYILWGINVGERFISQPGFYAALTPQGIEFTIWTSAGISTIVDSSTNIDAGDNVFMEFAWSSNSLNDYLIRTVIRINNVTVASSNPPINKDKIENLNFYVLNSPFFCSNLECTLRKLITYNEIPPHLLIEWWSSSSSSSSSSIDSSSSSSSDSSSIDSSSSSSGV